MTGEISPRVSAGAVVMKSPCWLWRGATSPEGYGTVSNGDRVVGVHRLAWESATGQTIPAGWHVDHLCLNPRCVNPDHLEAVPQRVNNLRAAAKGGRGRRCRACQQRWQQEWVERNRDALNARRRESRAAAKAAS